MQYSIAPKDFRAFIEAYDRAVSKEKECFLFQGHPVLTSYARWIVELITPIVEDEND